MLTKRIRKNLIKFFAILLSVITVFTTVDSSLVLTASAVEITPETEEDKITEGDENSTEEPKTEEVELGSLVQENPIQEAVQEEVYGDYSNYRNDYDNYDYSEMYYTPMYYYAAPNDELSDPEYFGTITEEFYYEDKVVFEDDGVRSEELYEMYASDVLGLSGGISLLSLFYAGDGLNGNDLKIYNALKAKVEKVANGELGSTVFEFSPSDLGIQSRFTLEELNNYYSDDAEITAIVEGGSINSQVKSIMNENLAFDANAILNALLADCPFELYWYFKSSPGGTSCSTRNSLSATDDYVEYTDGTKIVFSMYVDRNYTAIDTDHYSVDLTKTGAAMTALNNVDAILSAASSMSDFEKLKYYKDQICENVSYDTDAATRGAFEVSVSPWQIINVFDKDPSTNVVCEGYSKAFAYLCEKTVFNSPNIWAYTVTGTMNGGTGAGLHMWNIVHMSDDKNYLVDVTNCDSGSVGSPDKLFMRGYSTEIEDGYTFDIPGQSTMSYIYDDETKDIYWVEELEISSSDYEPSAEPVDTTEPNLVVTVNPDDAANVVNGIENGFEVSVNLNVTFSDAGSGINTNKIYYKDAADGDLWTQLDSDNYEENDGIYTFDLEVSGQGKHEITVSVEDIAGNEAQETVIVYIFKNAPTGMTLTGVDGGVTYDGSPIESVVDFSLDTQGYDEETVSFYYKEGEGAYIPGLPTDAGTYTIKASFGIDYENYYTKATDVTGVVIINKAESELVLSTTPISKKVGDEPFTIDITNKVGDGNITYSSSDTGVATVSSLGEVTIVGPGTSTVSVDIAATRNYTAKSYTVDLTVGYIATPTTILYNGAAKKEWYNISDGDVKVSAEGYTVSTSLNGEYTSAATVPYSTDGTAAISVYFQNAAGQKSDTVNLDIKYDRTVPSFPDEGGIQIAENKWKTLLSTITFGRIYKANQDVDVIADDVSSGSGIDKYYYYIDKSGNTTAVSSSELDEKPFVETSNSKIDTISSDSKYVYYVYVTDIAGNRSSYICSDGVIFDNTAPALASVTNDVNATNGNSFKIDAIATDSASGVKEYYLVYQKDESGDDSLSGTVTSENISGYAGKVTSLDGSFTISGLEKQTTYCYAVAAIDNAGLISNVEYGTITTKANVPTFNVEDIPTITGYYGQSIETMNLSSTTDTSKEGVAGAWSIATTYKGETSTLCPYGSGQKWQVTFTPTSADDYDSVSFETDLNLSYLTASGINIIESGLSGNNGWRTGNVLVKPEQETQYDLTIGIVTKETAIGTCIDDTTAWLSSLAVTGDGITTLKYYIRDISTGAITEEQSREINKDSIAPTGTITISNNTWNTFLNDITFGIFFKETKQVTISSSDATSGVESIKYYLSSDVKSLDDIKNLSDSDWTSGKSFTISPNTKAVIYAKITDKAGNVEYISSQGLIFDDEEPSITLTPNGINYAAGGADAYDDATTVTVSVTDDVNGSGLNTIVYKLDDGADTNINSGDAITINTAGSHTVVVTATDNAGNVKSENLSLKVYKAAPALSITPNSNVIYDGTPIVEGTDFTVDKNGNPGNVKYSYKVKDADDTTYVTGLPTDPGTYTIKGEIEENNTTCLKAVSKEFDIKIDLADAPEILYNGAANKGWYNTADGNVLISALGCTVSDAFDGTFAPSYQISYLIDGEESRTLYFKNALGQVSKGTEVKVKFDHTAPTFPADGGIKIDTESWRALLNTITFGKLFTETKSVSVSASDGTGSGIDKYYYLVDKSGSTSAFTAEQLAGKTFTASTSSTIDSMSADSKYVYYVYVTDKARNKSQYICSDGVVLDTTAPEISSVSVPDESLTDNSAVITASAVDLGSGVKEYYLVVGDASLEGTVDKSNIASNDYKRVSVNGSFSLTGLDSDKTYYYALAASDQCDHISTVKYGNFKTKKFALVFTENPIISGTLGQKLSEMTLLNTSATSDNGVAGTWAITQANSRSIYPIVNGSNKYEVTFTPNDASYEPYVILVAPRVSYLDTAEVASTSGLVGSNGWYRGDVTISAPAGYKIAESLNTSSLNNTVWNTSLPAISAEGSLTKSYYLKNDTSNLISAPKSVTVNKDTVAPTASISVGSSAWNSFLSAITFNTVFKGKKTVTISASDAVSGVAKTEYYKTSTPKTIDEIRGLSSSDWVAGNSFAVSPYNKLVTYARVTDKAGNVVYISSGGMVFEEAAEETTEEKTSSSGNKKTSTSTGTSSIIATLPTTTSTANNTTTTNTAAKTTANNTAATAKTTTSTTAKTQEDRTQGEEASAETSESTTSESTITLDDSAVASPVVNDAPAEEVVVNQESVPAFVAPGKEIVSQEVRTNDDGSTTTVDLHQDGSVRETTSLSKFAETLNQQSTSNSAAPTRISKVEIAIDKTDSSSNAQIEKITTVIEASSSNGKVGITPSMVTALANEVVKKVGETESKAGFDIKINTLATDGKPVSMVVSSNDLKNNKKLTAYTIDPATGSYVLTSISPIKYDKKKGLVVSGLSGDKEYRLLSKKEAKKIDKAILKTVKISDEFSKPVIVKAGEKLDMSKAISSHLNTDNVSKIEYSVRGKKATIDKSTGLLSVNNNVKGAVTVKIKVTLNNGKTKKIKSKIKIN